MRLKSRGIECLDLGNHESIIIIEFVRIVREIVGFIIFPIRERKFLSLEIRVFWK